MRSSRFLVQFNYSIDFKECFKESSAFFSCCALQVLDAYFCHLHLDYLQIQKKQGIGQGLQLDQIGA